MRKVFPLNLGGSDTCYFCKKRVYVMERLSAEGHFFHRECFRCSACATTLRLAAYAFDGDEGNPWGRPSARPWWLWDALRFPRSGKILLERGGGTSGGGPGCCEHLPSASGGTCCVPST